MIVFRPTLQFSGPAAATKRDLAAGVRDGLQELGIFWHSKYLPLHFETSAFTRYSDAYTRRKKPGKPMVKTGAMRAEILSFARVTSSTKSGRVKLHARAMNFWGGAADIPLKYRQGPNFNMELTATNQDERLRFARRIDAHITRHIAGLKRIKTVRASQGTLF